MYWAVVFHELKTEKGWKRRKKGKGLVVVVVAVVMGGGLTFLVHVKEGKSVSANGLALEVRRKKTL